MGASELNWFTPTETRPDPFVSVLVYMPGEDPLPPVHEGYRTDEDVWWSNGFFRKPEEIVAWAEMPEYKKPDEEGTLVINRKALIARFQKIHKMGFGEGYYACYTNKETSRMSGRLDFDKLPHFQEKELKTRFDDVFQLIDEGNGPVVVEMENGKQFIVFSWEDYMERFGILHSKEELEAIIKACKESEEA